MSGKTYQDFDIELSCVAWQKNPNGLLGLDVYFDISSKSIIELPDVKKLKAKATDSR